MQWQGWTAYSKTSQESCSACGMGTYTDGVSTEVKNTVKRTSLHLDHWIQPKSREHDKHIWSVVRLRFEPVAESLNGLIDLL